MDMKFFPLYFNYRRTLAKLSDEELGCVIRAVLEYCTTGEAPELDGRGAVALDFLLDDYEAAKESYLNISNAKAEAGRKGAKKRWAANESNSSAISYDGKNYDGIEDDSKNSTAISAIAGDSSAIAENGKMAIIRKEEEKEKKKTIYRDDSTVPEPGTVLAIPLCDKTEYPILETDVMEWQALYPAVDVMQELRNMRGWCLSHPKQCKTRRGVKAFVNTWLSKEQNRGGRAAPRGAPQGKIAANNAQFQQHGTVSELGKAAIAEMLAWGEANMDGGGTG